MDEQISGYGDQEAKEAYESWKHKHSNSKFTGFSKWLVHQFNRARLALDRLMSCGKTEHQQSIEQMMRKAGQRLPKSPTVPDEHVRLLRARLILEEAHELIDALGFGVFTSTNSCSTGSATWACLHPTEMRLRPVSNNVQLAEIAKESADLSVVTVGTLSACGINDRAVLRAVDSNNLAKFGPGGYSDEHGKWCKPPGHHKPDVEKILKVQGWKNPSIVAGR